MLTVYARNGDPFQIHLDEYFHLVYHCLNSSSPETHDFVLQNYDWDENFEKMKKPHRNALVYQKYLNCRFRIDDEVNYPQIYDQTDLDNIDRLTDSTESYDLEELEILVQSEGE